MVDLSPCMLNDEVAYLHVERNRLVGASYLDILPPSFEECTSNFVGKSNFFMFDRIYTIIHQHLCHQISSIRFMIKYIFIIYLFGFTNIDIFLHKFGQTLR